MESLPNYLKQHAHNLASVTDGNDFSDLQPLKKILENTRIVGLGESTHGTREFFQLKHRITRFLVEEMGYRVFTIEAGVMPCQNINDYVMMGKGDRSVALASQGYWVWDTEEVTDMIEWMRQHNLSCNRGDECGFVGYDIKPIPDACATIRRLIKPVCEDAYKRADEILSEIENIPFPYEGEKVFNNDKLFWLLGWISARQIPITEAVGAEGYELLVTATKMMYQYFDGMVVSPRGISGRDMHMAENVTYILNSLPPDAKIVVWAHNAHIAVNENDKSLGWWLRQRYGDLYFPFALSFTKGQFQSRIMNMVDGEPVVGPLIEFDAPEIKEGFWNKPLAEIDGDYYLDLKSAIKNDEETRKWATENSYEIFSAGGWYSPEAIEAEQRDSFNKYILGKHFDGLFNIEKTTRAIPTPTGRRDENAPMR